MSKTAYRALFRGRLASVAIDDNRLAVTPKRSLAPGHGLKVEMAKQSSTARSTRGGKIAVGDVLAIGQANGKHTLAYILGFWPELESIMSVALLREEFAEIIPHDEELVRIVSSELTHGRVMAVVSTPVHSVKKGEWPKIGAVPGVEIRLLLPECPFVSGSIVGCKYEGAPMVEGLINAFRGLAEWDELLPGRPGYLKSLLFGAPQGKKQ